jgi:hypothetical protein
VDTCSHCGAELPDHATFCPACGRRTDAPPPEPIRIPVPVQQAARRDFGVVQPLFVLLAALALIGGGIVLVVLDYLAGGVIAIVVGLCLLPAFLAGARRRPDTPLARASVGTADRVRDEADVAAQSIATWSKAGRDVVRLRREQFQLRRQREARIRELGVSAYSEDGRADELKAAAKELTKRIEANAQTIERTLSGARKRVRKERATVVVTEVIAPEPADQEDEDAPKA